MSRLSAPLAQAPIPHSRETIYHRETSSLRRSPPTKRTGSIHGKTILSLHLHPILGLWKVTPNGPRIVVRIAPLSLILVVVLSYASVSLKSSILRRWTLPARTTRVSIHSI